MVGGRVTLRIDIEDTSAPVITGPDNLFALPELDTLMREELALLPAHAARLPAGRALLLQACEANRDQPVDARHLGVVRGHASQGGLRGDVVCAPEALPWEDDAFQLVFAQHVGDALPSSGDLLDELARVLAPGGVLLWCGLNPWSPWLAWIHWQARHGLPLPRLMHADIVGLRLMKRQLAPAGIDHVGACWPQAAERVVAKRSALLAPLRGAWMIAAKKQRAVLTPLRPRAMRERVAMRPHLAAPSRRACA